MAEKNNAAVGGERPGREAMGAMGVGGRGGAAGGPIAKGTWGKLLTYCRRYTAVLVLALVCAVGGTVLTLAGPNILSDMTDAITDGIKPDTDELQKIVTAVQENVQANQQKLAAASASAAAGAMAGGQAGAAGADGAAAAMAAQAGAGSLQAGDAAASGGSGEAAASADAGAAAAGQAGSTGAAAAAGTSSASAGMSATDLDSLPDAVAEQLFTDITVDGVTISGADQRAMLEVFANLDQSDTDAMMAALDTLPASVKQLVEPGIDMQFVTGLGLTLMAFYVASYLLSAVQGQVMAVVSQRVTRRMRSDISHKINRLPMAYYNRVATGDVLSRVTNDVDTIGTSLNQSMGMLVSAVVLFGGSLAMMLLTNGWMTLAAVGASLVGFVLMGLIMGRSQKYFARQQADLGALNGHIEEMYSGHTVVTAYNGEDEAKAAFDKMNGSLVRSNFRAQCLSGLMMPIMTFIGNFGYVAVCVVGGALALDGQIGFGVIVAFMLYVRYFTQPLAQIAQAVQTLQSAGAAGSRVFEFLGEQEMPEEPAAASLPAGGVRGEVEFDHVRFTYEGSDKPVIKDFSAHALPGQKIAIVGPTGAGKTTMVNLLMRFHEIDGGQIRIDGVPTSAMRREDVHGMFCMVLQDTWLFEGTIRENLVYCAEGVSDERMREACRAVGLDHYIRSLPAGYDTVLNDQVNLSAGQKQQMTIARAMIANKPMLILDEATSSVDTRTEQQIQQAMDALMEGRTSFVIAHRLSTIKNADLILVMREGDIVESGTHDELLAADGFYADLYNSQFAE